MAKRLSAIFALFIILCAFQHGLYHQTLGNIAAIDFPDKPEAIDTLGQHLHHYTDSSGFYLAGLTDLPAKDGGGFSQNELDSIYSGFITGTLSSSNGKLVSKKPYRVDELEGFEIKYITDKPNLSNLRFKRILFMNNQMLYVDFWTDKEKEEMSKTSRERFFSSLKINADNASQLQGVSSAGTVAFGLGYIVGQVMVWVALAGVIVGIVLFFKNRKKKQTP